MPNPGEQHASPPMANPFEETKPHIQDYTAQQVATLQSRLDKQLGPEYVSARPGAGGQKVYYLAADKAINLANEVFGFNGWSSSIQNIQIDFVDENPNTQKISLGLSVIVRVTLKDGSYHEDIGYGHTDNTKGKAMAFEKAKKEGTTDALKRALRNFGNLLGNCIYDKEYISKVTKVKVPTVKWDPDNLHRAPQFAPVKKEPVERALTKKEPVGAVPAENFATNAVSDDVTSEDEFGVELFDEADFGDSYHEATVDDKDAVMRGTGLQANGRAPSIPNAAIAPQHNNAPPPQAPQIQQHQRPRTNAVQAPNKPDAAPPYQVRPQPARPESTTTTPQNHPQIIPQAALPSNRPNAQSRTSQPQPQHQNQNQNQIKPHQHSSLNNLQAANLPGSRPQKNSSSPGVPSQHLNPNQQPTSRPPNQSTHSPAMDLSDIPGGTFFSCRSLHNREIANSNNNPISKFDPHVESPSIRKTAGISHAKSVPVTKTLLEKPVQSLPPAPTTAGKANNNPAPTTNFVDPSRDANRRVGAPPTFHGAGSGVNAGSVASGGMSTSSFRSPVVKRNAEGHPVGVGGVISNPAVGHGGGQPQPQPQPQQHQGTGPGPGPRQYQPRPNQGPHNLTPNGPSVNPNANANANPNPNPNLAPTARRPPLNDVTNTGAMSSPGNVGGGLDVKRMRTEGAINGPPPPPPPPHPHPHPHLHPPVSTTAATTVGGNSGHGPGGAPFISKATIATSAPQGHGHGHGHGHGQPQQQQQGRTR